MEKNLNIILVCLGALVLSSTVLAQPSRDTIKQNINSGGYSRTSSTTGKTKTSTITGPKGTMTRVRSYSTNPDGTININQTITTSTGSSKTFDGSLLKAKRESNLSSGTKDSNL